MSSLSDFLTAKEASDALGISYKAFLQRVKRNKIEHTRLAGKVILIPQTEVKRLKAKQDRRSKRKQERQHPLYSTYQNMIRRCYSPGATGYERYGGRGIEVCDQWRKDFMVFVRDMGPRPSDNHTVDREDNDGPYNPNNCRWATRKEQANNRGDRA